MFAPKHTKYRKQQKGRIGGIVSNTQQINQGKYAIRSLQKARLKASTVEAVRRAMTRKLRRNGQIWVRVFPDLSVTSKPLEVRMGKGKGGVNYWACRVKVGETLYEIDGVYDVLAKQAAKIAASKLPMKTVFVKYNK